MSSAAVGAVGGAVAGRRGVGGSDDDAVGGVKTKNKNKNKKWARVPASHHSVRCLGQLLPGRWTDASRQVEHLHPFPPNVFVPRKQ